MCILFYYRIKPFYKDVIVEHRLALYNIIQYIYKRHPDIQQSIALNSHKIWPTAGMSTITVRNQHRVLEGSDNSTSTSNSNSNGTSASIPSTVPSIPIHAPPSATVAAAHRPLRVGIMSRNFEGYRGQRNLTPQTEEAIKVAFEKAGI